MTAVEKLNLRGVYLGWHAYQLSRKAKQAGRPMAELFRESIRDCSAFTVPARAIKATSKYVTYQFSDQSEIRIPVNDK